MLRKNTVYIQPEILQYLCLSSREYYLVCQFGFMSCWVYDMARHMMTRHDIKINNKYNFRQPPSLIFCRLQPEARKFLYA